jgi:hypothetical protein
MMLAKKVMPDGRIAEVMPLTYGRARIIIGDGTTFVEDSW